LGRVLKSKQLKKVAVTGGIASGKSTVCSSFKDLGAYVLSTDEIAHQLLDPTTQLGKSVIALLGDDCVEKGQFNRKKIAKKVFKNTALLYALEKLIHPEVQRVVETAYKTISQSTQYTLFVVEVPLLFESGQQTFYDKVIVVISDETVCQQRFEGGATEFMHRTQRLMPLNQKLKKADFIIDNRHSLAELHQNIQTINISLKENP